MCYLDLKLSVTTMLKLILLLLLYDVHASKVKVLSNERTASPKVPQEELKLDVASGRNITDFTLCLRVFEHVYNNKILK